MLTLYGLKNCDSCRKAASWLKAHDRDFTFHDVRDDGLTPELLTDWEARVGWENLLNRKGTTWRSLADPEKSNLDRIQAINLMLTYVSLIKRPILDLGNDVWLGFTPERYSDLP